jgi:trigger factor
MSAFDKPNSRNIPLPIQRAIRQRCGFGCVICGLPLHEYEHMLGWSNVKRHVADEITLLCDKHHREKTGGLLPLKLVQKADKNPYNLRSFVSRQYDLHYTGDECEVVIGSNRFTTKDTGYGKLLIPLSIDDTPLIGFILAEGHLLLNLTLFDENNELVLQIKHNQLLYSISPWDIRLVGRNLVIREAARKILVDIVFEVPNRIIIKRGRFLRNGVEVIVTPDYTRVVNNGHQYSGLKFTNHSGGIFIGHHSYPFVAAIYIENIHRASSTTPKNKTD